MSDIAEKLIDRALSEGRHRYFVSSSELWMGKPTVRFADSTNPAGLKNRRVTDPTLIAKVLAAYKKYGLDPEGEIVVED